MTFTAAASGGALPYEYKWIVFDGVTSAVVQTWSISNTFVWNRPRRMLLTP